MAKKEIAKSRQAVIVEGYTDVMAAHLAGIPTAVATCGTAFGADHIRILRRLLMDDDAFRGEVILLSMVMPLGKRRHFAHLATIKNL
jgi:DNA primase